MIFQYSPRRSLSVPLNRAPICRTAPRYASIRHMPQRTTVFLDDGINRELHLMAQRSGVPFSSLVRDALKRYVEARGKRRLRSLRFLAVGRSGRSDTSERHEELLWNDLDSPSAPRKKPRQDRMR